MHVEPSIDPQIIVNIEQDDFSSPWDFLGPAEIHCMAPASWASLWRVLEFSRFGVDVTLPEVDEEMS